ncbi:MFS transporter [Martelella alba]|uniref:MFS transporter n=1 Tax=Martelella alba TaxID=2590451 RepID=A0ABY2SN06_9HYPH|nr:MFS transporter [Martelella alba]TKI05795.1 MFS transporter [Martelella alba]
MDAVPLAKGFPPIIKALFLASIALTVGRGLSLPFLALYLSDQLGLTPGRIGLVLGAGLALGIIFSLYGGYLVDRFNKRTVIAAAMSLFTLSFFVLPQCRTWPSLVLLQALIITAYSQFSITLKAIIAEWLPVAARVRAFSLNYTLVNIGWAVGPPLGVMAAAIGPVIPFYLSGAIGALATAVMVWLLSRFGRPPAEMSGGDAPSAAQKINFRQTLSLLRHDKRLIYFTLGGLLGSMVFSQFANCLSQYLMVSFDNAFAYRVVGIILPVNATVVITLQYLLSRRIKQEALLSWLVAGNVFFIVGLLGFMLAQHSLPLWIIGVAIFSLGEIITIPVEYLFIDFIAPPHLKGSYYGMQNLANLGGAANPVVTGFLLTWAPPDTLFVVLIVAILLSLGLFYRGFRFARPDA